MILRSIDDGEKWKQLSVPDAATLDFRDIEAFGADVAYVLSSGDGDQSRIYKTTDGGINWKLQYLDTRPDSFLDSLACSSITRCVALSDPVDGKFLVLGTSDGEHWKELPRDRMPAALPKEGAFAASGTAIALCDGGIYFGTGGPAARIFHSADSGNRGPRSRLPFPAATRRVVSSASRVAAPAPCSQLEAITNYRIVQIESQFTRRTPVRPGNSPFSSPAATVQQLDFFPMAISRRSARTEPMSAMIRGSTGSTPTN